MESAGGVPGLRDKCSADEAAAFGGKVGDDFIDEIRVGCSIDGRCWWWWRGAIKIGLRPTNRKRCSKNMKGKGEVYKIQTTYIAPAKITKINRLTIVVK